MDKNNFSLIIVDHMQSGNTMVKAALEENGYDDIRVTTNAQQALETLNERHADIVLADSIMPGMDGLELTDQIRQQDESLNRYTSVILFSENAGVDPLVEAFERGADDYFTKLPEPRELASRVYAAGRISALQNNLFQTGAKLSRHNKELKELSYTDPLTGLGNLRYFQNHLGASLDETTHRGGATCCAVIDIDHFKKINDTHSHSVGNEILVSFSKRLRSAIRPTDIIARIGGNEFAIIMHYTDQDKLKHAIFKRIQMSITTQAIHTSAGEIPVTASMGICSRSNNEVPMKVDMILKCADQKLSKAKSKGENQVIY